MGKLSIPRLALAITLFGTFLLPPTETFAAKTFLEKLFSGPQETAPKRRKPRAARSRPAAKVVTPAMAPIPAAKPDQPSIDDQELAQSSDIVPSSEDNPQAAEPPASPQGVVGPPMPQPKPAVPEHSVQAEPNATLPENVDGVPVPEPNPRAASEDETQEGKQTSEKPTGPVEGPPMPPAGEASPQDETPPENAPIPEPDPRNATDKLDETTPGKEIAAPDDETPKPMLPDPRSADHPDPSGQMPAEEIACRQRLTELGVKFDNRAPETDAAGCSIPYPLVITSLGKDIGLEPDAEMNCAMAEAAAKFAKDVMSPTANKVFGKPLKSVSHASAYVCRPRAGTQKLSEHAFGNALDISSFTLSDGTAVAVELNPPEKNGRFVSEVRRAACGPFKTVLGPGDPDHSEHLHFDLAPRRNGGTVCE
jgi:hypothetical protein